MDQPTGACWRSLAVSDHANTREVLMSEGVGWKGRSYGRVWSYALPHCWFDLLIGNSVLDFPLIDCLPINNHKPTHSLADSNGTTSDLTIVKQFTQDALQDKMANDENMTKRGITTCETSGTIQSANGYIGYIHDGCSDRYHRLKWGESGDFDDGDSGSIAYQQVGYDQVGVAGTCNGRDPQNGRVFGASAWWINDNHGYTYV